MQPGHRLAALIAEEKERVASSREGRKGSVIAEQYKEGLRTPKEQHDEDEDDRPPSNEEVAKAVQQKVAAAVEMSRKYRHVAWYSIFVGAYMAVLYLQANAYKSGDVVQTLKAVFGDGPITFQSEAEVLQYLGEQVLVPIWTDPVCGDGNCEYPWEFPAWGSFGCQADCGLNPNVTSIVIKVHADFTGHPTISPRVLMTNAAWNLCLQDDARRKRGEADLCWYSSSQTFSQVQEEDILTMNVIDGKWYISVTGDYAGRVGGTIYDATNSTNPVPIATTPAWEMCTINYSALKSPSTTALRRLLQAYTHAHRVGGEEGRRLLVEAVDEVKAMPELSHIDFNKVHAPTVDDSYGDYDAHEVVA